MQELILYIKPQHRDRVEQDYVKADFYKDEIISLTQVIQDIRDIDKVFTDFSKTFNLPASVTNNKLFQHWYNPDVEGFDSNIQSDAKIQLNYQDFKDGKIKLQEVVMKDNRPSSYKVTFFGKTVSLGNLFREDKLSNLKWLNEFTYLNSSANILAGLNAGLDFTVDSVSYTDAIIYPLISHSQRYIFDDTGNLSNQGNLSTASTNNTKRGVLPEDLKPAIKASVIVKAIEEQYDITFKTSEFLDSTAFSNLYLWLHRDKGKIQIESTLLVNTQAFTCTSSTANCNYFGDPLKTIYFQTGSYYFGTTVPLVFLELFSFSVTITPDSSYTSTVYSIEVIDTNTGQIVGELQNTTGTKSVIVTYANKGSYINILSQGQNVVLACRIRSSSTFAFGESVTVRHLKNIPGSATDTSASFDSDLSALTITANVYPAAEVPDMKIMDFMKGIFKLFNLTAYLERTTTGTADQIVVKDLDSFYDDSSTTHDLTDYIIKGDHIVSEALPFSSIKFDYPEAKTKLALEFFNLNNSQYGELTYLADSSFSNEYNIAAPFQHPMYERLTNLNSEAYTEIQYGFYVDAEDNSTIGAPLLFYGIYNTSISPEINYVNTTRKEDGSLPSAGTRSAVSSYWMAHNANELGSTSTAPAFNLNYGSEINTYTLTDYGGANNSLFLTYYSNYIVRVFNTKTRIFKYKAILPLKFLLTFTLADKVFISGREFTINKITTNLQTGESELELLNEA